MPFDCNENTQAYSIVFQIVGIKASPHNTPHTSLSPQQDTLNYRAVNKDSVSQKSHRRDWVTFGNEVGILRERNLSVGFN